MFAPAEPFPEWTEFPSGLQVLLVGKDINHLNSVRLCLERSHYNVTTLRRGEDAITALQNSERFFHLALVEATQEDEFDGFKVLKAAGDVPTIMLTETEEMAIIMQGIILGAADFLQIPVTEEKLRNIWHHVARKALIAGGQKLQEPAKQLNDSGDSFCESIQGACSDTQDSSTLDSSKNEHSFRHAKNERTLSTLKVSGCDKLFTLQRPQDVQLVGVGSCEHVLELSPASDRSSEVKLEIQEIRREVMASTQERLYSEIKFEDYACSKVKYDNSLEDIGISNGMILDGDEGADTEIDPNIFIGLPDSDSDSALDFNVDLLDCGALQDAENEEEEDFLVSELVKLEEDSFGADMLESFLQSPSHDSGECMKEKKVDQITSDGNKKSDKLTASRKKKIKVDWTAELHHKFVQAVEHLGVEKAIPSKILELMGVKCLTRHNVASHLQKYRSHRKHHLYRESRAANWRTGRFVDLSPWVGAKRDQSSFLQSHKSNLAPIQPRLPVAMYPVQPTGHFSRPPLHVWGHPAMDHSSVHMWHQPSMSAPTTWCSPGGTIWQHPATSFDSWVSTSPALGAPCLPHPPMKIPLAPASSTIQVGIPVIPGEEEFMPDHPTDSGDSELSVGAGAANLDKPIVHLPQERVDAVINEVLKNPITSLPLGLKPPSLESVLAEVQKQGINGIGRSP